MQKETNFEVNLFPVISLLAVLISFLLLTAVWEHIGSLSVKQAVGQSQMDQNQEDSSSLWIEIDAQGTFTVQIKERNERVVQSMKFRQSQDIYQRLTKVVASLHSRYPQIHMAFVAASAKTPYQSVIRALEILKLSKFKDIGVSPLG
ncbi:MAG: biopolymer transporter ExbD [Bdellovibrionales bacterium]|nr:biopolymer transporter ExbD [Bdellovibrionales bacterium]